MTKEKGKTKSTNRIQPEHQVSTLTPNSKEESLKMSHLTLKNIRVWQKNMRNSFPL